MDTDRYLEKHKEICDRLHCICVKKNHDYGDSASKSFKEFGLISYIIRMNDKMNRLKTLSKEDQLVMDEKIEDTISDLANYCILALTDLELNNDKKVSEQ